MIFPQIEVVPDDLTLQICLPSAQELGGQHVVGGFMGGQHGAGDPL